MIAAHVALAVEGDLDHAAAGLARHLDPLELGLHLGHARLHGLGLLHHLAEILHELVLRSCSPALRPGIGRGRDLEVAHGLDGAAGKRGQGRLDQGMAHRPRP